MKDYAESETLLDGSKEPHVELNVISKHHLITKNRCRAWTVIHISLLIAYTLAFLASSTLMHQYNRHSTKQTWSPADATVSQDTVRFAPWYEEKDVNKTLFGPPSDTVDLAWEQLLKPINTWYTEEEVAKFGQPIGDPVIMSNGKYLGSTTVYHHLHCIKRLYQSLHAEHYYPELDSEEKSLLIMHNMHCLDFLRQAVVCQGDTTPIMLIWAKQQAKPIGDVTYQHSCVNWNSLHHWAVERTVDIYEPGLVVHPIFGPAYANMTPSDHQTGLTIAEPLHG